MIVMTGKVHTPGVQRKKRALWEMNVWSIVRHFGKAQVDMFGRLGWMTEER